MIKSIHSYRIHKENINTIHKKNHYLKKVRNKRHLPKEYI